MKPHLSSDGVEDAAVIVDPSLVALLMGRPFHQAYHIPPDQKNVTETQKLNLIAVKRSGLVV